MDFASLVGYCLSCNLAPGSKLTDGVWTAYKRWDRYRQALCRFAGCIVLR